MCGIYKHDGIGYVGIPKKMRGLLNYNELINVITKYYKPSHIHYLGFVKRDLNDALFHKIHGIDTKYPIKNTLDTDNINYFYEIPNRYLVEDSINKFMKMVKWEL